MLIVDTAAGHLASRCCSSRGRAQHVLVVIRDEPAALTDAYALIKVLSREHGVRHFRVLVNMTRRARPAQALFRRLQRVTDRFLEVVLDYVGEIPEDENVAKAVRAQRPVVEAYPGGASAQRLQAPRARPRRRWPLPPAPARRPRVLLRAHGSRDQKPRLKVIK